MMVSIVLKVKIIGSNVKVKFVILVEFLFSLLTIYLDLFVGLTLKLINLSNMIMFLY